jgi:hypothetical protein
VLITEDEPVEDGEWEKRLTQKLMMADAWGTKATNKKTRRKSHSLHRLQLERFNLGLL